MRSPTPAAARSFAIELGAVELRARWMPPAGARRAPVLVFLHDSLGSVELWRDFADRLARAVGLGYLAYDRRGHGASSPLGPDPRTPRYLHDEAAVLARILESCDVAGRPPGRVPP